MTASDTPAGGRLGGLDPAVRLTKPGYVELVFSLVIVWGFGDAVSTLLAAEFAGVHLEANPWMRLLLTHNPMWVVVLKAAVVLYVGIVLLECRPVVERVPLWRAWLTSIVALGALIVLSNLYVGLVGLSTMV